MIGKTSIKNLSLALTILVAVLSLSCAGSDRDSQGIPTRPNPLLKTATLALGPASLLVELAQSDVERERGLMFRQRLEDGRGMLFIFESDQILNFWMKNTLIPLSIAWIGSDGLIKGLADMRAQDLNPVGSERSVRYALEVPQGWFERAGVKIGDRMELPPRN